MREFTIIKPDPELKNNLMAFGFDCGEGWYPLIHELLNKIQDIADRDGIDLQVVQIKEKFGSLRVYMNWETDEVSNLIEAYERKSVTICEVCGKPGELKRDRGWYSTTCAVCENIP